MKIPRYFAFLLLFCLPSCQSGERIHADPAELSLIPYPQSLEYLDGTVEVTPQTVIQAGTGTIELAEQLGAFFVREFALKLPINPETGQRDGSISLKLELPRKESNDESYQLEVFAGNVTVSSSTTNGVFYGIQTLKQILSHSGSLFGSASEALRIPCVLIQDRPRFSWRGLMLDCSRTFLSPDYLRKTMDRMSYYKMNILHLHLTDDQGWRIEVDRYPELTRLGSRFAERFGEPEAMQGFYSKRELRDLVEYGSRRGITIVPEIEMPGHSLAALSCYPDLSCEGGPFEIFPFFQGPNVTSDILCAGNDDTLEFIKNVLEEVLEVFPSEYIHVGGDEVPKNAWEGCSKCQTRIRKLGLENEEELQGWFIQEIGDWLQARNRRLLGWDEILEGQIGEDAAVMSWRGIEGGIDGATLGHRVVMSPASHLYLDFSPIQIPIKVIYSYQPIPDTLTAEQAKLILGIQGNFWSHIDRIPSRIDAMIYPRLLAIAERAWSTADSADWESFSARLPVHNEYLTKKGVVIWEPPVAEWSGEDLASSVQEVLVDVTERVKARGRYSVFFRKKAWEDTKIKVNRVALLMNGRQIASDDHQGVVGWEWNRPDYVLNLPEYEDGQKYQLRIELEGTERKGGGEIYFGLLR